MRMAVGILFSMLLLWMPSQASCIYCLSGACESHRSLSSLSACCAGPEKEVSRDRSLRQSPDSVCCRHSEETISTDHAENSGRTPDLPRICQCPKWLHFLPETKTIALENSSVGFSVQPVDAVFSTTDIFDSFRAKPPPGYLCPVSRLPLAESTVLRL